MSAHTHRLTALLAAIEEGRTLEKPDIVWLQHATPVTNRFEKICADPKKMPGINQRPCRTRICQQQKILDKGTTIMTRLQPDDICHIIPNLADYSRELEKKTGRPLLGIACHACNMDERQLKDRLQDKQICVVPVTAGLGIISRFSDTVAAILTFLGCRATVADQTDVSGVAHAFAAGYDALMMADDHRFVAIDLHARQVTDNADATGRGFAAALDLMAGGIRGRDVLVLGCGPVGAAGAGLLASKGARTALLDTDRQAAVQVRKIVSDRYRTADITIEDDLETALSHHRFILEATPVPDTITGALALPDMRVAAPGVPLGVSAEAAAMLGPHLVHDTLEIGVAVMAASLLCEPIRKKR